MGPLPVLPGASSQTHWPEPEPGLLFQCGHKDRAEEEDELQVLPLVLGKRLPRAHVSAALSPCIWPGRGLAAWGTPYPRICPAQEAWLFLAVSVYLLVKALRKAGGRYQELSTICRSNHIFNRLGLCARNRHCPLRKITLHFVAMATEVIIPFDSVLSLLGVYSKEVKQLKQKAVGKQVNVRCRLGCWEENRESTDSGGWVSRITMHPSK